MTRREWPGVWAQGPYTLTPDLPSRPEWIMDAGEARSFRIEPGQIMVISGEVRQVPRQYVLGGET